MSNQIIRVYNKTSPPTLAGEIPFDDIKQWYQVDTLTPAPVPAPAPVPIPINSNTVVNVSTSYPLHLSIIDDLKLGADDIPPIIEWDFGDKTANSKYNNLEGFNVAHLYNQVGNYTATVKVAGNLFKTWSVVVIEEKQYPIYVANNGNDSNNGLTQNVPVKTIAQGIKLVGSKIGATLLLKCGDIFDLSEAVSADFDLGSYGDYTLSDPIINWIGPDTNADKNGNKYFMTIWTLATARTAKGVYIKTNCPYVSNASDAEYTKQHNQIPIAFGLNSGSSIIDCTADNVEFFVNLNNNPDKILIQDCSTGNLLRDYHAWVQGTNIVILGSIGSDSKFEHLIRISGKAKGVCIAYCDFTNLSMLDTDSRNADKGGIVTQESTYVYTSKNLLRKTTPQGAGPLGRGDGVNYPTARTIYYVSNNDTGPLLELWHGLNNALISNSKHDRISLIAKEPGYPSDRVIKNVSIVKPKNCDPIPSGTVNVTVSQ